MPVSKKAKKQSKGKSLFSAIKSCYIVSAVSRFTSFIYNAVSRSVAADILTSYDSIAEKAADSLIVRSVKKKSYENRRVKHRFSKFLESSGILSFIGNIFESVLYLPLNAISVFLFSFGISAAGVFLLDAFYLHTTVISFDNALPLYISAGAVIIACIAMFSKKTVSSAICQSRVLSFVLFEALGIRRESFDKAAKSRANYYPTVPFVLGLSLGLLTFFISPLSVIVIIPLIFLAYMVIINPEAGVVLLFFALPLCPRTYPLIIFMIWIAVSFFFKYICGKRLIKYTLLDFFVTLFMLFTVSGGVTGAALGLKPMLVYICFMLGYFIVKYLMRSTVLSKRCLYSLCFSSVVVSIYGIYQYISGMVETTWQDMNLFSGISGRAVSTFDNPNVLGEFLLLAMPLTFALFLIEKNMKRRTALFIAQMLQTICLLFTWSRGAWVGFLISFILMLLLYSRNYFTGLLITLPTLPFFASLLPSTVSGRFTSIGNFSDTSTAYRLNIWRGTVLMLKDKFISGIGIGEEAFAAVYPEYALSGIQALHSHNLYLQIISELGIFGIISFAAFVFFFFQMCFSFFKSCQSAESRTLSIGFICAVTGFLIQGMTDYVWYNYRIFFLFWLICGLAAAFITAVKNEAFNAEAYYS